MPLQPKHLNYENTQFLLIGEGYGDFGKALELSEEDQGNDKETPREELEKLEDEDGNRIERLKGMTSAHLHCPANASKAMTPYLRI